MFAMQLLSLQRSPSDKRGIALAAAFRKLCSSFFNQLNTFHIAGVTPQTSGRICNFFRTYGLC